MNALLRSPRTTSVLAGAAALLVAALVALATLPALADDERPHWEGTAATPDQELSGSTIRVSTEGYINYDVGPRAELPEEIKSTQRRYRNVAWIEVGPDGDALRIRGTSSVPDGTVFQDRLYDAGVERMNSYELTGEGCSEPPTALSNVGSGVLRHAVAELVDEGFEVTEMPPEEDLLQPLAGDARAYERVRQIEASGFPAIRSVVIVDGMGLELGMLTYGIASDGNETLLASTTNAVEILDNPAPEGTFQLGALPACALGRPAGTIGSES